jgi:hypothetical protein
MGSILLESPWVRFYLVLVSGLLLAFFWDYCCNQLTTRKDQD